ncbi:MAG: hypothetical protein ACXAE3_02710 [Candidatus Kariarchaeaceae archaeon]|jgi:hypothetical protein
MDSYQIPEHREKDTGPKAPMKPRTEELSKVNDKPPLPYNEILVSPTKLATMVQTYSYEAFEMHWELLDVEQEVKKKLDQEVERAIADYVATLKDNALKVALKFLGVISVGLNIYLVF